MKFGMAADKPGGNGLVQLIQSCDEKMVSPLNKNKACVTCGARDQAFDFFPSAVFVVSSLNDQLGLVTGLEIGEIGTVDGKTHADKFLNANVATANAQAHPRAETEATNEQRDLRILSGEEIDSGLDVAALAQTAIMRAGTQARTTKIETQNRNTQGVE